MTPFKEINEIEAFGGRERNVKKDVTFESV